MSLEIVRDPGLSERPGLENLPQIWREALYSPVGSRFAVAIRLPNIPSLKELRGRELLGEIETTPISKLLSPYLIIPVHTTTSVGDIGDTLRKTDQTLTIEEVLVLLTPDSRCMPMLDIMALINSIPMREANAVGDIINTYARNIIALPRVDKGMVAGKSRLVRTDMVKVLDDSKSPLPIPDFVGLFQEECGITVTPVPQDVLAQRIKSLAEI